ncbi:MAG TPA: pyridoxal 5'-phosphate synthase glutaminase subunit PdxT [Acidimicrobiales bacterium]|nr:pyridoxal 5'-phosphate synthase glutaminase subunit PdxT [Acidimicrobiales bacterium]
MEIGILALQGDVREHGAALADIGVVTRPVRVPDDLAGLDGLVLPGGESTTISMLLESSGLAEPLAKELAAGLPAFGTCAGLILLGASVAEGRPDQRCFGAIDIAVRRNGFGRQLDSFECDLSVDALGEPLLHAVFIRAPLVESVGERVQVLATLSRSPASGSLEPGSLDAGRREVPVVCRQGPVLVSAFHPELTADRRLHALFVSMIDERGR